MCSSDQTACSFYSILAVFLCLSSFVDSDWSDRILSGFSNWILGRKKKILTLKISAALEKNLVGRLVQSCVLECFCLSKSMVVTVSK